MVHWILDGEKLDAKMSSPFLVIPISSQQALGASDVWVITYSSLYILEWYMLERFRYFGLVLSVYSVRFSANYGWS